jgi:two-component system, NarL family, response regulator NreC
VNQLQNWVTDDAASRVLLADGNLLFRRGLRVLLAEEQALLIVADAGTPSEVISRVQTAAPDVLVVSLELLTEGNGQLGILLRQSSPRLPVLVLTQNDSPENLEAAISAGATGYMLRDSAISHLSRAIRQVALSASGKDGAPLPGIIPDLRALAAQNPPMAGAGVLTSREQEVVRLLAEGRTVRQVAKELSLSSKTVEAHKLNLMRKLNIHNRASLVDYALRKGMVSA